MAIKNSNDGIAMTKSIEGAIAEVSDMLQRMRELSIQAANGTNSASDRTYLQDEVNLLIQEITRVSANTRYNGSLILDGTFINKQLQVGIEEGEHITFSVDSVAASQIGAHTLVGNGVNPETPGATAPANPITTAEDIEIFGYLGTKLIEASTQDTAKEVAQKVNLSTSDTGVRAYAKTYAALSSGDSTSRTYNIKINDYQTGNFVISSTDVSDAVEAINRISGASGVTAKAENNKVVLFDADGDDIRIENTKAGAEFVDLVVEKLGEDGAVSNVVGQPIRLGQSATSTSTKAVFTQPHGTEADYKSNNHSITDGTTTLSITATADDDTAAEILTLFKAADGYDSFKYDIAVSGTNFTYTAREPGVIQTAERPILTTTVVEGTMVDTTAGASADATRVSGTLKFVSAMSFSVEQAGDGANHATTPKGYFNTGSQTATLMDLTQIKISSEAGASDAISIIDAALDKVAQMRSDLGAIENRMDHTISNLMNIAEKTADSRSRLEDADFALESARLAKNQVLQQAGTSMLSQANQMSQMVLELLRG
jgi:flagellin